MAPLARGERKEGVMKRVPAAMFIAFLVTAHGLAETSIEPNAMTGLWAARRDFGPQVRGTLSIDPEGGGWRAHIAGRTAPASIDRNRISFELPNGEGRFRGTMGAARLKAYWIQPHGVTFGNDYATPVTLVRQPGGGWRGTVRPLEEHITLYMPLTRDAKGELTGWIRNTERNVGRFLGTLRIVFEGTRVQLLGNDGKVVGDGRYDADNATLSVYMLSAGVSFDFHRATPAEEAAFRLRAEARSWVYHEPPRREDGWAVGSIDDSGIDREALARFIRYVESRSSGSVHAVDLHAFLLARHGKLVVEEYFHGTSADDPHDTRSAAKSLAATLVGASMLHGYPVSPATPVYEAMYGKSAAALVDQRKRAITLQHLLTMSSGLDCDDSDDHSPGREDTMQEQSAQPDWYRYTLDLEMIRNPGQKAVYCSCQPNLAGGVLGRTTSQWLPDLFRDLIAAPLQFGQWGVNLTPTGDAYMGGGMRLLPRDFMKVGQMMIDGGRWHGRQIVSATWAKRSATRQTEIGGRPYGYLWWLADYPWHGRKVHAFFAAGNGGQIMMAIPELDLVLGFFGGNYGDGPPSLEAQNVYVPDYVLPAVR
jgi:CubicO group peptidase (beta-lactamase class C family)